MAMPLSGSIAIISAPQACGSICAAVGLASGSLSTLSVAAAKVAPHAMTEFYGFAQTTTTTATPWTPKTVNLCAITSPTTCCGTLGSSTCALRTNCIHPSAAMVAGECYNVGLTYVLSATSATYSAIDVWCNGASYYYDCAGVGCCISGSVPTFTVRNGETWCVYSDTNTGNRAAASNLCLNTVTNVSGSFTRGTPNYCGTYTGTMKVISLSCTSGTGTIGVSPYVCRTLTLASTPAMAVGECYTYLISGNIYAPIGSGGYACICIVCNSGTIYGCCSTATTTFSTGTFTFRYGDTLSIGLAACNVDPGTYFMSYVYSCVCAVTGVVGTFGACTEPQAPSTFCWVRTISV